MNLKNILFAAHDPGGANVIAPIIKRLTELRNYRIYLLLLGPAKEKIKITGDDIINLEIETFKISEDANQYGVLEKDIEPLFSQLEFNFVFTGTSFNSNLEKLILKHSKRNRIYSAAFIDAWSNYKLRFYYNDGYHYPDLLFATDESMRRGILNEGISSETVVCGNPNLEKLMIEYSAIERTINNDKIRLFSDPYHLINKKSRVNEFTILETMVHFFENRKLRKKIIIRPHPTELRDSWDQFLNKLKSEKTLEYVELEIDRLSYGEVLQDNFISIGISTMALIETSLAGIPTMSWQIEFDDQNYFYIPFEEYGIRIIKSIKEFEHYFANDILKSEIIVNVRDSLSMITERIEKVIVGERAQRKV